MTLLIRFPSYNPKLVVRYWKRGEMTGSHDFLSQFSYAKKGICKAPAIKNLSWMTDCDWSVVSEIKLGDLSIPFYLVRNLKGRENWKDIIAISNKTTFLSGRSKNKLKRLKNWPCRSILEMEVDTVNDQKIIQKICFSKLAKLSFLYIRRYFNTMLNLKLHIWSKIRLFETGTSKGGDFCACLWSQVTVGPGKTRDFSL